MDKCPQCGYVEQTQTLVHNQVMTRFVRTKDKAVGIFNNGADRFTVPFKTGRKNEVGEEIVEVLEWVKESVWNAEQAAKAKDAVPAPATKTATSPAPATPTVPKTVVEPALAAKPVTGGIRLG